MIDREKVIKGLEYHIKELSVGKTCYECPYFGDNPCEIQLIANTLELLKEQEPRVLTLEEAKKAEVCWLEQRGYEPYVTDDADTWNPEIYGKAYRCWSAKPTDEQRKAEKWE